MSKAKKGYVLKFSEAQKKFFEALLQELDRENKKPLPFVSWIGSTTTERHWPLC